MTSSNNFDIHLAETYPEAVNRVIDALKVEGFGVLTRIDVHNAFKEKLGVEFRPYTILGACNPQLAHRAISAVPEVGLFLPCNVTVESEPDGGSLVRVVNPDQMMKAGGFDKDKTISSVGAEALQRLRRVVDSLEK